VYQEFDLMNHHSKRMLAALALALLPLSVSAQSSSPQLSSVLQQMDKASKNFHTARAELHCDYYERVVNDTTTQVGPTYFLRQGDAIQMGLVVDGPDGKPQKVVDYKDGILQVFDPGVNQITVVRAGANQAQFERYFALGFGASGTDLAHAWNIKDLGPETLSDGGQQVKTEKLDLTSKDGSTDNFKNITIWVDPLRSLSLRQIFYLPNNDRRTCNYSNVKLNDRIDQKTFAIKKNAQTTIINH
jgi:outer membrane lipoprotein-sorting protein